MLSTYMSLIWIVSLIHTESSGDEAHTTRTKIQRKSGVKLFLGEHEKGFDGSQLAVRNLRAGLSAEGGPPEPDWATLYNFKTKKDRDDLGIFVKKVGDAKTATQELDAYTGKHPQNMKDIPPQWAKDSKYMIEHIAELDKLIKLVARQTLIATIDADRKMVYPQTDPSERKFRGLPEIPADINTVVQGLDDASQELMKLADAKKDDQLRHKIQNK